MVQASWHMTHGQYILKSSPRWGIKNGIICDDFLVLGLVLSLLVPFPPTPSCAPAFGTNTSTVHAEH